MNRQVLDEASSWFVDFRVGDMDSAALARFDEWLRTSPEHVRAYMQIAATYVELPKMTNRRVDPEVLIALARAQTDSESSVVPLHRSFRERPSGRVRRRRAISSRPRIAAACTVIVVAGLFVWRATPQSALYVTDIGERRSLLLADGSSIELNARSKVRVQFSRAERDIALIGGQAFFRVAKDRARPFVVRSDGTEIRAVGTQFDVDHRSGGITTVTVAAGEVAVLSDRGAPQADLSAPAGLRQVLVKTGEQVTVGGVTVMAPKQVDVAASTAWLESKLVFDNARLQDVVEDFNRYTRRPLIVDDAVLRDFHISGSYSSQDPTSLIHFLEAQPDVRVIETDESIRIVPAQQKR